MQLNWLVTDQHIVLYLATFCVTENTLKNKSYFSEQNNYENNKWMSEEKEQDAAPVGNSPSDGFDLQDGRILKYLSPEDPGIKHKGM